MSDLNSARLRRCNDRPESPGGDYVLYWMQAFRRLTHNHALDFALDRARSLGKPLVVYEGLKLGYRWASARLHQFILEGMRDNARLARAMGVNYWPFVETPDDPGRGLLRKLSENACLVVTDDYPCFIVPEQTPALAAKANVAVTAVDGNSIVPLNLLGAPVAMAAHLRPRIHKAFAAAWASRAVAEPVIPKSIRSKIDPPFALWNADCDIPEFVASLPIDQHVKPVRSEPGGSAAAKRRLREFVDTQLPRYADGRNAPTGPDDSAASRLSAYLHFGHISIEEIADAVLHSVGDWDVSKLNPSCNNKREGFFTDNPNIDGFLDEALTWRDIGFHWHWHRRADAVSLDRALPPWAKATLHKHADDRREHLYSLEEWEAADTHDPLWNAAQKQLVAAGRIHNYLRMLWGKKVLEWSATPQEAYETLEHLNNKYALDGRDPNSYTGILWCFGLFDRPWPPERNVFGTVRFMSSANTARKFKLEPYYRYVAELTGEKPSTLW